MPARVCDRVTLRREFSGMELLFFVDVTPLLASEVLLLKPLTQDSVDIRLHLWHFVKTSYILKPFDSK